MSLARSNAHAPAQAPAQHKISIDHELKDRFRSDQYKIEQPYIQITQEGYTIHSVDGSETFTAVRPRHIIQTFMGRVVGVGAMVIAFIAFMALIGMVSKGSDVKSSAKVILSLTMALAAIVGSVLTYIVVSKFIAPLRRATIKDGKEQIAMEIEPTSKFQIFNLKYAIRDSQGITLATFERDFIESIFQKHWHAYDARGKYLFSAVEDKLWLALMRRYLNLAKFIPMHFMFKKGAGKPFGEFRRGYSLRDKYKLRYNPAAADAWLMVAAGIMLDTGENR